MSHVQIINEPASSGIEARARWPLASDGLPSMLFPDEHLRTVFFELLPLLHQCSASTIRQGLKAHLKRTLPGVVRHSGGDQVERDRTMASIYGNSPAARDRTSEIVFTVEQFINSRGRGSTRGRQLPVVRSFADLLFDGYRKAQEMADLHPWLIAAARREKEYGDGVFLTAETFNKAMAAGDCPSPPDDIWWARSIVLLASRLPAGACNALLEAAVEHGCFLIREAYFKHEPAVSLAGGSEQLALADPEDTHWRERPRLLHVEAVEPRDWHPSAAVCAQSQELLRASEEMLASRVAAEKSLSVGAGQLIDGTAESWKAVVDSVTEARDKGSHFAVLFEACRRRHNELIAAVKTELGWPQDDQSQEQYGSAEALSAALQDADAIGQALKSVAPPAALLANWRRAEQAQPTSADLWELVRLAEQASAELREGDRFREAVREYCSRASTSEITAFLATLDSAGHQALLVDLSDKPWVVAGALLLRVSLDKSGAPPPTGLLPSLTRDEATRRAILRFVDPTSALFDRDADARRLIAAERLRDALIFGPLAQISDPASGLSDVELVGRPVYDLIELVASGLDMLEDGIGLLRMLRPVALQEEAEERLLAFIQAPVTMTGNFRRLRETAREQLMVPLLKRGRPDPARARALGAAIASGESLELVIGAFEQYRPDDRLEARHREQLTRYLSQAESHIEDFLRQTAAQPDARQRSFTAEVSAARAKLRGEGSYGSVEWLEAEVGHMLDGRDAIDDHRTLVGNATPILDQLWDDADREWAASYIDLPEFHADTSPAPLEVAASVLRWKSRGTRPTTNDVVHYLIEREAFPRALRFAEDAQDETAKQLAHTAAQPAISALERRREAILQTLDLSSVYTPFDQKAYDAALAGLDAQAAEEILDFWQLALAEDEERRTTELLDAASGERRKTLLGWLHDAGLDDLDDRMSMQELEAVWSNVLVDRKHERAHLTMISATLRASVSGLPILSEQLAEFDRSIFDPTRWLPAEIASDFSELLQEAVPKIANWIAHAEIVREEEKQALLVLSRWFLDFVLERSLSLHGQDDGEGFLAGLDRVLQVADVILRAQKPSDCLAQLSDGGELEIVDPANQPAADEFPTNIEMFLSEVPPHPEPSGDYANVISAPDALVLPQALSEAISKQEWSSAVHISNAEARNSPGAQAERLRIIVRATEALADDSTLPASEVADMFPAAAAWISNPVDGAESISESRKVDIAFQLLSGAVAADSGHPMPRTPGAGGAWAELLGRQSPFRRMLSAGLPSRTGRVLEALVSSSLGQAVAERIWDAATNLGDPQTYRTPLLTLLIDHGAQEVVIKLAQRHEPAVASRLSQLFELRAVAQNRSDLLPVAQSVADQIAVQAKPGPFRSFVRGLPSAAQLVKPMLRVATEGSFQLRPDQDGMARLEIPFVVTPEGLVPAKLHARLFAEDDVTFEDNSRRRDLSNHPIYFATDFTVALRFGPSWFGADAGRHDSVRIRIEARTVTEELVQEDVLCPVRPVDRSRGSGRRLDVDTLLDLYPGVANNPVVDDSFIGRIEEIERLHQALVSARNPSPVLLTGMRRVGKTSLLYAFHKRCRPSASNGAISIYQSLAERRVELSSADQSVSGTFFKTISHGLVRPNLPADDRNHALCSRIRQRFSDDWRTARRAIQDCYDEESLSGSLMVLAERLREWTGWDRRFIFLIDEAEALVAAYQAGGRKKIELEQFLQSLREVSQTTASVGILLSGSNHINMFAREYKNAFFGSSQAVELEGFPDVATASKVVAPKMIENFVHFEQPAIDYAWELCAGMPQFLWQLGATTAFQIKTGVAARSDIRAAVATLLGPERVHLPFKPYEMLEPIDSMLSLETARERDLLWMLLYRIAQVSSLAAPDATIPFVIDQSLLAVDDKTSWRRRLRTLADLKALRMESLSSVRFQVPLFAEAFRAPKNLQEFNIRQQQVAI